VSSIRRRTFLKVLAGSAGLGAAATIAGGPLFSAFADPAKNDGEFFVFIHASGGWDVTLWSDPRNERKGIVDPATTANTDTAPIRNWIDQAFEDDVKSFSLVTKPGCNITFGPGIGNLLDLYDRLCVINGIAMNTVSHPDGTAYSATGRHLVGGRMPASSIDTMMANELGREQTFPSVSVNFPSSYVGDHLDRRVVPLRIGSIGAVTRTLSRSNLYDDDEDRDAVTALLSKEARDLALKSNYPDVLDGMAVQYEALRKMLSAKLQQAFSVKALQDAHPDFNYKARFHGASAVNAAFAVEAMKRNVVRCVSFAMGGFDTHASNYRFQAQVQQDMFDMIASLVRELDKTPHPTKSSDKLGDHTHILVVSDFCRTPQINVGGGRDHYPNNSALVISPRFRGNLVFGKTDPEQLLPRNGARSLGPPDVLATFVSAFGVDPRRYLRDGVVVKELLKA